METNVKANKFSLPKFPKLSALVRRNKSPSVAKGASEIRGYSSDDKMIKREKRKAVVKAVLKTTAICGAIGAVAGGITAAVLTHASWAQPVATLGSHIGATAGTVAAFFSSPAGWAVAAVAGAIGLAGIGLLIHMAIKKRRLQRENKKLKRGDVPRPAPLYTTGPAI